MRMTKAILVTVLMFGSGTAGVAQEVPKPASAGKELQWLHQFEGRWESKSEALAGPGQPPMQCHGTMTYRKIGELWMIADITGDMPGTTMTAVQTLGYDEKKKKYVGTWVDSMMNHMWVYEGHVDASGKKLILEAEGPNFVAEGKTTKFRDAYEFQSPDHIIATSSMQTEDGQWVQFMTGHLRRKK